MDPITFDKAKLNKEDTKTYDTMTAAEKASYEKTWVLLETQKAKLLQKKNKAKTRYQREQKALSEKSRKERTHRLIERGAILESLIEHPEDFSNEDIKAILERILKDRSVADYIEQYRASIQSTKTISQPDVPAENESDDDYEIIEDLTDIPDVTSADSHISQPLD